MTRSIHTNDALEAACEAIEEWELTPDEEAALVTNLLGELQARREIRNEAAWEIANDPERIAARGEAYRRDMIAAGRGGAGVMGAAKHTPGPWVVFIPENYEGPDKLPGLGVEAENGDAVVWYAMTPENGLKNDADADIISAAPEMLDALKSALATIEDYLAYRHDGDPDREDARIMGEMDINDFATDGRLEKARAAIIKAEGRT